MDLPKQNTVQVGISFYLRFLRTLNSEPMITGTAKVELIGLNFGFRKPSAIQLMEIYVLTN